MRARYLLVALFAALLLSSCSKQVLFSALDEREANEIVAALYAAGLDVSKVPLKGGEFRVDVDAASFSPAVEILQQRGLPRERFESLGQVFTKEGFVSSPLEERARLNYALSQEIAQTISNIDGVIIARVHLAVPDQAPFTQDRDPASASVFVKHRADVDLGTSVGKIKSMVVTGLENVPYENVTVGLFPAAAPFDGSNGRDKNAREIPSGETVVAQASFATWSPAYLLVAGALMLALSLGLFAGLNGRTRRSEHSARSSSRTQDESRAPDNGVVVAALVRNWRSANKRTSRT